MKIHFAILLVLLLCPAAAGAQVLLSDSLMVTFTQQEMIGQGVPGAQNGVSVYKLRYATTDAFGEPTVASGALVLPDTPECYHALACYMHGTILERDNVPSRLSSEILVGYFLGAYGYVAVLPDYLGLGDSPGMHPYIHADTEASASLDMLRAAREFCEQQDMLLNGQLFLAGYSQGGHACMATHKLIEEQHADEFTVTASAPCSGPYDVSGVQAQVMVDTVPYPAPYYLPYVLFAYREVYPWLYDSWDEVLQEPWATVLPPLFDGTHSSAEVDAVMPSVPSQILQDSVLQAFSNDPDHPFRLALQENDLYDWAPQAPVRMLFCEADSHVFYENSMVALDAMNANGAPFVQALSMGASLDHGDCAFPALLGAKGWFDSLQGDCSWSSVGELDRVAWSVYPNPARDHVRLKPSRMLAGPLVWELFDARGARVGGGTLPATGQEVELALPRTATGLHLLRLGDGRQAATVRLVLE